MRKGIFISLTDLSGRSVLFWLWCIAVLVTPGISNAQERSSIDKMSIEQCLTLATEKEKAGDVREATRYLNEVANRHWEAKEYDQAIKYYTRSIEMNRLIDNENGIAGIQSNLGLIYFDKGEYEKSVSCFRETYKYRHAHNEKEATTSALINMSVVLNKMKCYDETIKILDEAATIAREMNDLMQMRSCYGMLSETYTKAGNTAKAADYFYLYKTVHEAIQDESQKRYQEEIEQATVKAELAEARQQYTDLELLYKQRELYEKDRVLENLDSTNRVLLLNKTKAELIIENLKINEENAELMRKKAEMQLKNAQLRTDFLYVGLGVVLIFVGIISFYYIQKRKINRRLEYQNAEIKAHRNKILEQNTALENAYKEISQKNEDITHSIDYAEYIQKAFLTTPQELMLRLPDSFIYMKACAIVSGDFFWYKRIDNKILVACIDCTGHGVPGAFMSLIGSNLLTQITEQGLIEPNQILNVLNMALYHALRKQKSRLHSGMDMALYCIDYTRKELAFAGAKMPLIYVRDGKMHKIQGDPYAIGSDYFTFDEDVDIEFRKYTVPLDRPTWVYLATDGYQSQFSFLSGKKFQSKHFQSLLFEIHQKPMDEQKEILQHTMEDWLRTGEQVDDILVIGTKIDLTQNDKNHV